MVMTCVISPCGTDDGLWSWPGHFSPGHFRHSLSCLVQLTPNTMWDRLDSPPSKQSNIKISSVLSSQILSLFSFEPQPIGDIKIIYDNNCVCRHAV